MKLRKTTGMYCQGRVSLKKTNLFSNTFCKWFKLLSYLLIRLFLFRMDQDTFMTNNNIDIGRSENISKLKTTIDLKDKWYTGPRKQKKETIQYNKWYLSKVFSCKNIKILTCIFELIILTIL